MARPTSTKPTITPFLRNDNISVRLSFRGLKYRTPALFKGITPNHIAKNGYIKNTHTDYLTINTAISAATDRLEQVVAILLTTGEFTEQRLNKEYTRLTSEAIAAGEAEALMEVRKEAKKEQKRKIETVVLLPSIEDEIAELQAMIVAKQKERDNMRKELNLYQDDTLDHFLDLFRSRKGDSTMEASTDRTYRSFIQTVKHFDATVKIQDVDDNWLTKFQDWLVKTPRLIPVYNYINKVKVGILRYDKGEPRLNGTISNYITKVRSCLKYYKARPEMLPAGCVITEKYKRFESSLPLNEDNVIALEEKELFELFSFRNFKRKTHEKAIDVLLFLCSTSLRFSDYHKVTPTTIKDGCISFIAKKTKKLNITVTIPINPISQAILEKYNFDMSTCKVQDYQLNERIKEVLNYKVGDQYVFPSFQVKEKITKYCGRVDVGSEETRADLISSHSGRRTYINLCLDYNVPINKIMSQTGHLDVGTLMVYANKRKDVKKFMKNIFQLPTSTEQDYYTPLLN